MQQYNDKSDGFYREGVRVHGSNYSQSVTSVRKLIRLRSQTNWQIEKERYEFLKKIYPLIEKWKGSYPDLRDIFRDDQEIEWLLVESVKSIRDEWDAMDRAKSLINFVNETGYRAPLGCAGMPRTTALHHAARLHDHNLVNFVNNTGYRAPLGCPGKPRTTALHHAARLHNHDLVKSLFQIYSRFDSEYISESGSTHFLVACVRSLAGGSQSRRARNGRFGNRRAAELLLAKGANPNLPNKDGFTPLHVLCKSAGYDDVDSVRMLFELSSDKYKPLRVDARDKIGNTPLHYALKNGFPRMAELLLRNGADANLANDLGSTPLHFICKRNKDDDLAAEFFDVCDDIGQRVRVDARDALDRTPLQFAVVLFELRTIDLLVDRGADLSKFVLPTWEEFNSCFITLCDLRDAECGLRMALGLLAVVDTLERRGYRMKRIDALTIMRLFHFRELLENPLPYKYWNDEEEFAARAKKNMIGSSLSLHESIRVPREEVAKLLLHTKYYAGFSAEWWRLSERARKHLREKLSQGFFRKWALKSLRRSVP